MEPFPELALETRYSAQLSSLGRIAALLRVATSPDEVASLLVDAIVEAFDASWVMLYRANPEATYSRRAMHGTANPGLPDDIVGQDADWLNRADTWPGDDTRTGSLGASRAAGGVPLDDAHSRLGWLVVGPRSDEGVFDKHDARFLSLCAQLAAPWLAYADITAAYQRSSLIDEATGFGNRRAMEQRLEEELSRSNRSGRPVGLIFCEMHDFAGLKTRLASADLAGFLTAVAFAVNQSVRRSDYAFRIDGGRIAVLVTNSSLDGAQIAADRIRRSLTALELPQGPGRLPVSIGVAALKEGIHLPLSLAALALVKKAEEAMHEDRRRAARAAAG